MSSWTPMVFCPSPTERRPRVRPRTCWKDYILSGLGTPQDPKEKLEKVEGNMVFILDLCPPGPNHKKSKRKWILKFNISQSSKLSKLYKV